MEQAMALAKSPHVIIATPGRLIDHLENTKGFRLNNIKFFIVDEADKLLNLDYEAEVNFDYICSLNFNFSWKKLSNTCLRIDKHFYSLLL